MLEARLEDASILKKLMEAVKDLVAEGNFECSGAGIKLQAMDSSHVSLVALQLSNECFKPYRCDHTLHLGISLTSMSKILKCAANDDVCTISAQDDANTVSLTFEGKANERISSFELKLMDIDGEHLGIPNQEYAATVKMPSAEFQRICRDLNALGEAVTISASKEGVTFSTKGDSGSGKIHLNKFTPIDGGKESKDAKEVSIILDSEVHLKFALRYLISFTKATPLSEYVTLSMSKNAPLTVEYPIPEVGYVKFYLAPKIDDYDEAMAEDVKQEA
eukprot:Nk52_evm18s2474 gene=Nk52_evmTU18s2474